MPAAIRATRRETVPLTTPMPCLVPCMAAKRCSNSATSGPWCLPHLPLRSARSRRASSGSPKTGQAVKGRVRTGVPPRIAKGCDMIQVLLLRGSPGFAGARLLPILRGEPFLQLLDVIVQGLLLRLVMLRELLLQSLRQSLELVNVSGGHQPGVGHRRDAGELLLHRVESRVAVPVDQHSRIRLHQILQHRTLRRSVRQVENGLSYRAAGIVGRRVPGVVQAGQKGDAVDLVLFGSEERRDGEE